MTVNGINAEIVQEIKIGFQSLNWFAKLFFPRKVIEILDQLPNDNTPISLELGRTLFITLADTPFFQPWGWLWLSNYKFQYLKTLLHCIYEENLSDKDDTHVTNKMNVLLACQNTTESIKIYAILQSADLITPHNLSLISSHPNLPGLLRVLEHLQQLNILTQKNIDTFSKEKHFGRINSIKLLEDAEIDIDVYREAIFSCGEDDDSQYLATVLALLHKEQKLPLDETSDSLFQTLIIFKDIIRYLRSVTLIKSSYGGWLEVVHACPPNTIENLSAIAHHSRPDLLCAIFNTLSSIQHISEMKEVALSQQSLNVLLNHSDLHSLKEALTCLTQAHHHDGSWVKFTRGDIDLLFSHPHAASLVMIMQVLVKNRLLTVENLNKLLSHPKPNHIHFALKNRIESVHLVNHSFKLKQTDFGEFIEVPPKCLY